MSQSEISRTDSSSESLKLTSGASPSEVAADLAPLLDFQSAGMASDELLALIEERLLPHLLRYDSPTFQSMFNARPTEGARLGAELALAFNQGVTNWQVSPGGAMLEELAGKSLCHLFDLAPTADATFMYSGTYANQQALYLALHRHAQRKGFDLAQEGLAGFERPERLAVLISEDAHFSIRHAVRMLGLGEQCIVQVPVNEQRRLDVSRARALLSTHEENRDFFCMISTAGTTSTGAVDPIKPLVDLCQRHGAWLHVDGAYGYAYCLVPAWAHLFDGHELADSITWDPHKQLGVPIPNSLLFLRDGQDFGRMALYSGYFNRADEDVPNPGLKSPPSTRPMAALPLVTAIRARGLDALVADLRAPLMAMQQLADELRSVSEIELCHQPDTGILCFRFIPSDVSPPKLDALQRQIYEQIMASGERSISTTKLDGVTVLRLVSVSPHIRIEHLRQTIDVIHQIGREVLR